MFVLSPRRLSPLFVVLGVASIVTAALLSRPASPSPTVASITRAPVPPLPHHQLVLLVDTTSSMGNFLPQAQRYMAQQIHAAQTQHVNSDLRVAIIEYRDAGGDFITRATPLLPPELAIERIVELETAGGVDGPEALSTGLGHARQLLEGKAGTSQIIVLSDAPPKRLGRTIIQASELTRAGTDLTLVRCGPDIDTESAFRHIANAAGGTVTVIANHPRPLRVNEKPAEIGIID